MKFNRTQFIKVALVLTLLVSSVQTFVVPIPLAQAQPSNYTLLEPLPCVPGGDVVCQAGTQKETVNFKEYVQYAFNLTIALAAVAAVFMIVWGGFEYMTTDSFQGKNEGKKKVTNAIYGLVLVLCSFLILRTVDPRLVQIPSTLVPQLELRYSRNALSSFMNGVLEDAQRLNIPEMFKETATRKQELEVLKTELDAQFVAIDDALASGDTERARQLEIEAADMEDEYSEKLSEYTSGVGSGTLDLSAAQATVMTDIKDLDKRQLAVDKTYKKWTDRLSQISNPPDPQAKAKLDESYKKATQVIEARKLQLKTN